MRASTGLRGIGPALAGNVGASWAFARPRDGAQDVDVPKLAPARSRCRRWAVRTAGEQFQKGPTFGESIPDAIGSARAKAYWKNPRMAVITQSTWSSVSSGYIGNGWMRRLTASATG